MRCDQVRKRWMPLAGGASASALRAREHGAALGDHPDSDLGPQDALGLAEHLAACPACAAEMARFSAVRLGELARSRPALPPGFWDGFHAGVLARIERDDTQRAFAPRRPALPVGFWDGWSDELAQRIAREHVVGVEAADTPKVPAVRGPWRVGVSVAWRGLAAAALAVAVLGWPWQLGRPVRDVAESPPASLPITPAPPRPTTTEAPWSVRPVRGFALDNSVRVKRAAGETGWFGALDVVRPLDVARPPDAARRLAPRAAPDFPIERSPVPSLPGDRASF